ncbi:hypothetical protein [Halanaeroarchaeum sulfurireducens]|uniref:Flagella-related protein F n=1 Tax=Halanaeroarchaeum sulfurireducens TaxID=1604004 RepID=A0A0F7PCB8_9EURY|nr:hypothetical protein [Halanaeroarchaeum sulfurireducens]AKH97835.1 flagella-related protein F [Halanaeroarchaeum sulfurireducens]ALG82229.1 flagella-related protein F [Halanaeroarchaeum sulfurireducens]
MGFSVSASTVIVFIAAFASVGMLYTSAYNGFEAIDDATMDQQDRALATENTAINVTDSTHDTSGTTDYVNLTVENVGSTALHVSQTDILLNGNPVTSSATVTVSTDDGTLTTGSDGTDLWLPGETLSVSIHKNSTDPRVKIVTETGVAETEVVA